MWLGLGLWARSAYFRLFTGNHSVTVRSYLCSDRLIFIYSDNHILFEGSRNLSFDEWESTSAESCVSHSKPDPPLILTLQAPSVMSINLFLCSQLLGSACSEVPRECRFDLGARRAWNWSEDHLQVPCVPWQQTSKRATQSPGPPLLCLH